MNFNSNHNDNLNQNIEGYLRGELSPMEARGFEQKIVENADLGEAVQFQKDIIETLKAERKAQLKARLQNIELPKELPQSTSTPFYANKSVVAAGIIAITGVSAALLFFLNTDKKEISTEISTNPTKNTTEISKENLPSIANNDNIFKEDKASNKNSEKSSKSNVEKPKSSTETFVSPIEDEKAKAISDNNGTENKAENTTIVAETPQKETTTPPTATKETKKINFEYQVFYQYDKNADVSNKKALVFITDFSNYKYIKDIDLGNGAKDYLFWNDLYFEITHTKTDDVSNLKDGLITDEKQILQLQTIFKKK